MNEYDEHRYDKTSETGKGYDQHQKLELNPSEKKRMENEERVEHLHEKHRVKT